MHQGGDFHDPGGMSEAQPGAAFGAGNLVYHSALHGRRHRGAHGGGARKRAMGVAHGNGPRHQVDTLRGDGLARAAGVIRGWRHEGDLGHGLDRFGGLLHVVRQAEQNGGAAANFFQKRLQAGIGV